MQCLGYAYGYVHNLALDLNTLVFSRQENGKKKLAVELANGSLVRYILIGECTGCSIEKSIFDDIDEPWRCPQ